MNSHDPAPDTSGRSENTASQPAGDHLIEHSQSDSVSLRRLVAPAVLILLAFLYILGGLVNRQLIGGDDYDEQFRLQSSRIIQVPAPRGHIYDRHGKLIVGNRPRYNIVADLGVLRDEIRIQYLKNVRDARDKGLKRNLAECSNAARTLVLQRHLDRVNRVLGLTEVVEAETVRNHLAKKRALDFPLVSDIHTDDVAKFVENFRAEDPLRLYVDSVRHYEYGDSAAHVLGYLRKADEFAPDESSDEILENYVRGVDAANDEPETIAAKRLEKLRRLKIKYPGKVGATGLELACNDLLHGQPGTQVWMVNPSGYLYKRISETKAEQGSHIYSSLDIDLQLAAETALTKTRQGTAREQLKGALVALDVDTGEVLAMASYPRLDPNGFADRVSAAYIKELQESGGELNRATQGLYPPGSTFKVITAMAAMRADKLTPEEILECGSHFQIGNRAWPEHDAMTFGRVNLARMLAISCNVYCYQVGLRIGPQPLADEARRFGLDSKIKLETNSATRSQLVVPDPKWKKDNGYTGWSLGDTANMAIGQGQLLTTPLHMACMIASVAGKRTRTIPTLLHDPARDGLTLDHHGEPIGLTNGQYGGLLAGLLACIEGGTGKSVKYPKNAPALPLDIAGKTGTAEFKKKGKATNLAWFVGFAPADNPRIAVAVMLEGEEGVNLHGGADAGPVARAVFSKWLDQHAARGEAAADTPAQ